MGSLQEMIEAHDYFRNLMEKVDTPHASRVLKLGLPWQGPTGDQTFSPWAHWQLIVRHKRYRLL